VGTNHIGHFALVQDFLPKIAKTAAGGVGKARVVYTGSGVHNPDEPGGDVGSKATLGDMEGLAKGYKPPISMVDGKEKFDSDKAYKDSKLCNVCTSLETARRLKASSDPALNRITVNVMNPGLIPTSGLFRDLNPFFVAIFTLITRYIARVAVSEEEGGRRLAFMVESPMLDNVTGGYFSGKPGFYEFSAAEASKEATNEAVGKKLWDLTEKIVKGK
jgi:protochlorophyllide reductase